MRAQLAICGDAAYALNPLYAQGITAAAIGSVVLDECLRERLGAGAGLTGLAGVFQQSLSRALAGLWRMTTTKDWHWPITEVTDTIFSTE